MLRFNKKYFLYTVLLLVVEILIALYLRDRIIRPYGGDFLVVILLYCAVRTIVDTRPVILAVGVLLFAYTLEVLQYIHLVDRLGLSDNVFARTVIGYGFDWLDLLAYTLGILTVLLLERPPVKHAAKEVYGK